MKSQINISNTTVLTAFLLVILTLSVNCSNPVRSLSHKEILEALLVTPPLPHPPLTTENATNPAYQDVARRCRKSEYFLIGFNSWIHLISWKGGEPVEDKGRITWRMNWYGSDITLTVIEGDTLFFELETQPDRRTIGWTIPWGKAAYIKWPHEYVMWDKKPDGLEFISYSLGIKYHSFHSPLTGGWLSVNNLPWCLLLFEAHWDANGHGYCSTGEW